MCAHCDMRRVTSPALDVAGYVYADDSAVAVEGTISPSGRCLLLCCVMSYPRNLTKEG
jgi:hypothetical protein